KTNLATLHVKRLNVWNATIPENVARGSHPSICDLWAERSNSADRPMLRHIPQPFHAGGLEADVGVEAAGDGAVDDGLLLLLQQLDQLLLGADVPPNPGCSPI